MPTPWLKKNPFMSMWLSSANRMAGTLRGQATGKAKQQISAAVTKATNENLKTLFGGTAPTGPKAKTKLRR
jgi:hypothetical protein